MTTTPSAASPPASPLPSILHITNSSTTREPYEDFYDNSRFATGLIIYPILCAIGLTCNSLAFVVLSHKKMATSTNTFLTALALADVIKLLNDLIYFVDMVLLRLHPTAGNYLYGLMYPVSHYIFNQSTSVAAWLTVSVAVERYLAVCHATQARAVCFVGRARLVSAAVFLSMSLLAVPSALRYVRVTLVDNVTAQTSYEVVLSELGANDDFRAAYDWLQNLLRSIVPLCALFVFNFCIISALGRRRRVSSKKKWRAKNRITVMLIVVILVFMICVLPDAVLSTCFGFGYADEKNYLAKGIREITDTLLALSSAVNFIIYCLCNKQFRDIAREMICSGGGTVDGCMWRRLGGPTSV